MIGLALPLGVGLGLGLGLGPSGPPAADPSPPVVAAVARDAATNVVVEIQACPELDPAEVARVLDLELQSVTAEIRSGPPLTVVLRCEADRLTITVEDPLTRKQLKREVPAPSDEPGAERIVALSVSELFNASWLELLTAEPLDVEPAPSPADEPPPPPAPAVEAARKIAERRTRPRRGLEILVGAGARARSLETGEPFAALRIDATIRGWLTEAVGVVGQVGWDYGQAQRDFGRVQGHVLGAAGGLAWRYRARPIVGLGGSVLVGAAWARLHGIAQQAGVQTGGTSGATGELSASVGPRITYGRVRLDLDGEAGLMLRAPQGVVDGQPPVSMGGVWVGVALRLGADVTRPRARNRGR